MSSLEPVAALTRWLGFLATPGCGMDGLRVVCVALSGGFVMSLDAGQEFADETRERDAGRVRVGCTWRSAGVP